MSIPAVGYVGAALIAATAAFIGLVLGKEQKTTEFRQEWINSQRDDLAIVMATARAQFRAQKKDDDDLIKDFDLAHSRMLLRENPDKPEWLFVLDEVKRLRLYAFSSPIEGNVDCGCERIVDMSRALLKAEWNRVRGGETWFVAAKRILPPAILFVAAAFAYGRGFIIIGWI